MKMTKDEAAARLAVQLTEQGRHGVLDREQFGPEPDDWGLVICRAQTGHDGPCDPALVVPVPQAGPDEPFKMPERQVQLLRQMEHADVPGENDLVPITEAIAWLAAQPGTMMTRDGTAILVLGETELAALARLLAGIDADAVPDGPDLILFGMLTAAVRQGLAGAS